jgi:hypothetical protein
LNSFSNKKGPEYPSPPVGCGIPYEALNQQLKSIGLHKGPIIKSAQRLSSRKNALESLAIPFRVNN